jgi:hypothetical protein
MSVSQVRNFVGEVRLRPCFNPANSVDDVQRHARGEQEQFPCVAGYRYFYLDWNLDIWRCK